MGIYFIFNKELHMGGINTSAVECSAFTEADAIEGAIDTYIKDGLIPEGEIMIYYSWYWWAMYIWNLNTQSFLNTMQAILDCGVSGGVDSKFGQDWIDGTWTPQRARMQEIFDILDMWWAPWIMILFQLPWPPLFGLFSWAGSVGYLVCSILFMLDYQQIALGVYATWAGDGAGEEGGEEEEE